MSTIGALAMFAYHTARACWHLLRLVWIAAAIMTTLVRQFVSEERLTSPTRAALPSVRRLATAATRRLMTTKDAQWRAAAAQGQTRAPR